MIVSLEKRIRGRETRRVVEAYRNWPPALSAPIEATWIVRQARSARSCDTCDRAIPADGLYIYLAGGKLCERCAREYGGYRGAWQRGARYGLRGSGQELQ
jgi:hypothetical protein